MKYENRPVNHVSLWLVPSLSDNRHGSYLATETVALQSQVPSRSYNLRDQLVPTILGFQNQFDNFANGSLAPTQRRYIVRSRFGFGGGIGDSDGETHASHQCDITEVVSDVTAFISADLGVSNNFFKSGDFVLCVLMDVLHLQLMRTPFD